MGKKKGGKKGRRGDWSDEEEPPAAPAAAAAAANKGGDDDAEGDGKARWATVNDSRVTKVGAFIRRTRIDELPQIFNVLSGEMSFIGPRPERPEFVQQLAEQIPYYNSRHAVKPGITGWAQLCYPYGASEEDARQKLQFDLYYVKNQSLFLDLMVALSTVEVVIFGKGAR